MKLINVMSGWRSKASIAAGTGTSDVTVSVT